MPLPGSWPSFGHRTRREPPVEYRLAGAFTGVVPSSPKDTAVVWFRIESLDDLRKSLRDLGGDLVVREGRVEDVVPAEKLGQG